MSRSRRALALVGAALAFVACKSGERARHEQLSAALVAPVRTLCGAFPNTEAGGCYRQCQISRAAESGRAALEASRRLVALPPFAQAETEALLEAVRVPARELERSLGPACPEPLARDAPVTPGVERCAEAANRARPTMGALRDAIGRLAADVQRRNGAVLPSVSASCPEP